MSEPAYLQGLRQQMQDFAGRQRMGMPRVGWKIGLNVPEVQRKAGLTGALVGFLDGQRVHQSGDEVQAAPDARLHIEPELCLKLHQGVGANTSRQRARAAIAEVFPALELVDYGLPRTDLPTIIAHSMFHRGVVLGTGHPLPALDTVRELTRELVFEVDGQRSPPARRDLIPADLAELVLRAAAVLAEVGQQLEPGDLLMSGAFVENALPLPKGGVARASFGHFGEVSCTRT